MTKEFQPNNLTNRGQNPYSGSGDKYMPEPGNVDVKKVPQTEQASISKQVDQERQRLIREHFEKSNERRKAKGEAIGADELLTQRLMAESGIAPIMGGADVIVPTDYTDPRLQGIAGTYLDQLEDAGGPGSRLDARTYQAFQDRISTIMDDPNTSEEVREEARRFLRDIYRNYRNDHAPSPNAGSEGSYFYLNDDDKRILDDEGVEAWINSKMDILYQSLQGGDASQSKILDRLQSSFTDAIGYKQLDSEEVRKLEEVYQTRVGLVVLNSAFAIGNAESVVGASRNLTAHRLLNGFALDDGRVGSMFSRITEVIEDRRLRLPRGHITPDMIQQAQRDLIEEQVALAEKGLGDFGDFFQGRANDTLAKAASDNKSLYHRQYQQLEGRADRDELIKREITRVEVERAVRASFDLFVSTQRVGVHMARGEYLAGSAAYRSEPYSFFTVYNLESLLWRKFNMLTEPDKELMRRMKLDLANDYFGSEVKREWGYDPEKISDIEKEEVGTRLFRDLFKIPDVFTSGWRIDAINEQLDELYTYKEAIRTADSAGRLTGEYAITDLQESRIQEYIEKEAQRIRGSGRESTDEERVHFRQKALSEILTGAQADILLQKLTAGEATSAKEKAGDMGLFMKLVLGPKPTELKDLNKWESEKGDLWKKISKYRPEEIIRLFRERDPGLLPMSFQPAAFLMEQALEGNTQVRQEFMDKAKNQRQRDALEKIYRDLDGAVDKSKGIAKAREDLRKICAGDNGIALGYDYFKEKYGAIVSRLRNKAFSQGRQLDTRNLSAEDLAEVDVAVGNGSGAELQRIYDDMRNFIETASIQDKYIGVQRSVIEALLRDDRFFDTYQRSLLIDDALLGELENPPENSGIVRLTERIGITSGGDMLVRMMNDTAQAKTAGEHLLKFMNTEDLEEKMKEAIEFASNTTYNGLGQRAKAVRFTIGTAFNLSKMPLRFDVMGIQKLPLRLAMTEIERIYGPAAKPISREQLRQHIDKIDNLLTADAGNPNLEEEADKIREWKREGKSEEEIEELKVEDRKENKHRAEAIKHGLERLLEITWKDEAKRRGLVLLFYLLLAIAVEGVQTGKATVSTK